MAKKLWPAFLLLLTLHFCHFRSPLEEAKEMARTYTVCTDRYDHLEGELDAKIKSTSAGRYHDKVVSALSRIRKEKKAELEKILRDHEKSRRSDELDLLRSKILIELGRIPDAERTIERLSLSRADLQLEARLQKVIIHLVRGRNSDALDLFREIEPKLKNDKQFFNIVLALAYGSPEAKDREEYSLKFLAFRDIPAALQTQKTDIYANLAILARNERQTEKSANYLEKALALNRDADAQAELRSEMARTALIGRPAPALRAEVWFNSAPLVPAALKGQVLVVNFWSPWCARCRELMPALLEEWRLFKDQGLMVISYTKLYGRYSDDILSKSKASAAEETALIKNYLDKNKISWPAAVGAEGFGFDAYAITSIPTLVLIDRRGNVAFVNTRTAAARQMREQIKSLLAEK